MPTSLTATKIKDTYGQVLHVDGGVTSTPKLVYDGDGTATALKVSTTAIEVPALTLSGGTPNGVVYANGSKVLTTGSALTFDGTNLVLGGGGTSGGFPFTQRVAVSGSPVNAYRITNGSDSTFEVTLQTGLASIGNGIGSLAFLQAGSEQMRLTSTGLGIGMSSPGYKLDATIGSVSGAKMFRFSGASGQSMFGYVDAGGVGITRTDPYNSMVYLGTGNTVEIYTASTQRAVFDSSGNLGLGVTPSAWSSGSIPAIDIGTYAGISNNSGGGGGIGLYGNAYEYTAGNFKYKQSYYATLYRTYAGQHQFFTAPSGTAGNAISFTQAMTLDASGNLGIGNTVAGTVNNNNGSGTLVVGSGSGSQGMTVYSGSATGNEARLTFANASSGAGSYSAQISFKSGDNAVLFYNQNAERMRIDSSGNVVIGRSSAYRSGKLTVSATNVTQTSTLANFQVTTTDTQGADIGGSIGLGGQVGGDETPFGYISGRKENGTSGNYAGYLAFATQGSSGAVAERMRIDSSGNLLVGCTSVPSASVSGTLLANPTVAIPTISAGNTTAALTVMAFLNGNGQVGYIQTSGSTTAYGTSSDYRLKENIQPMQNALDVVAQLNPVTYTWKADGSDGQGFIAHELQAVVPDCVTGEKDAVDEEGKPVYQGIDTSFLVATLTKAIQELKAELDATKAEVAALKGV